VKVMHRTFLMADQSVRVVRALKGESRPCTTALMAASGSERGWGVMRTTKRAVVVSEIPYRRKASVIYVDFILSSDQEEGKRRRTLLVGFNTQSTSE
jgi:hypothetical protein